MISLEHSLQRLVESDFTPTSILDVGCNAGNWTKTVKNYFPTSNFTMVDGIFYKEASDTAQSIGSDYFIEVLNDKVEQVEWFEERNSGDSMFRERTIYFANTRPVVKTTNTLDILLKDRVFEFIKIDTQGAEIPILKGGENLVKNTEVISLEIPFCGQYNLGAPDFKDHISFMDTIGFEVFDVSEMHYFQNRLIQIDIFFVRKGSPIMRKVQEKIDLGHW